MNDESQTTTHPAVDLVQELIRERDAARKAAEALRRDFLDIATQLEVEPNFAAVAGAIGGLQQQLEDDSLRKCREILQAECDRRGRQIESLQGEIELERRRFIERVAADGEHAIGSMLAYLAMATSAPGGKNYVELAFNLGKMMDKVGLPFERGAVVLYKPGGKTQGTMVGEAHAALRSARTMLQLVEESDGHMSLADHHMLRGVYREIDAILPAE